MSSAISAHGLRKAFGDVVAVDGVDLDVPTGTVLGLLGPNGAGKTTVVRMLTTLLRPDAGRAHVAGIDVLADPHAARTRIGLAGQYAAVDEHLTGRENLVMVGRLNHLPAAESRTRATQLLARFDLSDAADRPTKTYSGGMRRRLDLAAALVNRPPVLFLDEPTTGLDPRSRLDLWDVIRELVAEGTTLLLTTQYLEEADQLANEIVVVDQGRVIAQGTAATLKAKIGATVLEIGLATPAEAAQATALLSGLGAVTNPESTVLDIAVTDGPKALLAAARALEDASLVPITVALREPTLDDVFLTLTGQAAPKTAVDEAPAGGRRGRKSRSAA